MGPIRGHARASQSVSDEIINAHGRDVLFPDSSCTQPVVMGACAHGCSHGRSRPQGRPRALGNCMEILMRDAEGHLESRLSIRGGTVIATLLPTTQTQPSGHSSISIFCVLPFLPSSIKIVLGDSCDWPDPVPWQRAMLRSIFDRRPARLAGNLGQWNARSSRFRIARRRFQRAHENSRPRVTRSTNGPRVKMAQVEPLSPMLLMQGGFSRYSCQT